MKESIAYFDNYCPNCSGYIGDARLNFGSCCERCLPEIEKEPCTLLKELKTLKKLEDICRCKELTQQFVDFFTEVVGEKPWSLQVTWAKRVFLRRSFAIQAPTGIGKTTFGIVMAAFTNRRSYIVVPTKLLVKQVYERISSFCNKRIIAYTGKKSEKKAIESHDFDILITTQTFLQRNVGILPKDFGFVFVDDVDSVLKNPKNIDNLFLLIGLDEKDVAEALNLSFSDKRLERIKSKIHGVLVVSSATLKPKTKRISLFRNLLGFDIQRSVSILREIEDYYLNASSWEEAKLRAKELVQKVGHGVFIFVSADRGREAVEELVGWLKEKGIEAVSYEDFEKHIEEFKSGKIQAAVGIALSNNALVRGVDLPYWVKAAIFMDAPKFLFPLKITPDPQRLFTLLRLISPAVQDEKLEAFLTYLRKYSSMKAEMLDRYPPVKKRVEEICQYLEELITKEAFLKALKDNEDVFINEINGEPHIVIGDATSYIQASGRTSRLIPGGITKGLSVVVVIDKKAFRSLERRVRYMLPDEITFKKLEDYNELDGILQQIEASRKPKKGTEKDLFKSALVVVESPNKARTISSFFGRPQKRWIGNLLAYEVVVGDFYLVVSASVGHVADLTTKPGFYGVIRENELFKPVYTTIKRCKCGNQLVDNPCPKCGYNIENDKITLIESLRRLSFEVDQVFIATDPDAEGEKIAWDLFLALKPLNDSIHRIEFHEVTPSAFRRALAERREVDSNRVKAQMVRRIADRWVGFTLSNRLQREFNNRNLSAGRVQTPVLGWVIERDEETKKRVGVVSFKVYGVEMSVEVEPRRAKEILSRIKSAQVKLSEPYTDTVNPLPPFTTSELLKEASSRLRLSAEEAMQIAQKLFEEGYITYHRTDSTRVSSYGIQVAKSYIEEHYPGNFKARTWGKGGAHECIRPTRAIDPQRLKNQALSGEVELSEKEIRLYALIFYRFMASQMKEAKVLKRDIEVQIDDITSKKDVILEVLDPGFSLLHPFKTTSIDPSKGISDAKLSYVPKAKPFTEGTLVDEMKKRGLGRPSTYAKIVQTLLNRGYVVKRGIALRSTALGRRVYSYLQQFKPYTTEEFTRMIEKYMDEIEENARNYMEVLEKLYEVKSLA